MSEEEGQEKLPIRLSVNGRSREAAVEPRTLLVDLLRDEFGLTGTHVGCEQGICGACTVLVDGQPVLTCLTLAVQVSGSDVTTVEGLASGPDTGELTPLQQAFREQHALQCGFCTPGFLMAATALMAEDAALSRNGIERALVGNLCRCTGYEPIVNAVVAAADGRVEVADGTSSPSAPKLSGTVQDITY